MQTVEATPTPLTVTELNRKIATILETGLPIVWFQGEISEVKHYSSGHMYFTVKDAESQIKCAMWKSYVQRLESEPKEGEVVICTGKPNLYVKNGNLQIAVSTIIVEGEGELKRKFLELKIQLEKQGLFANERKRKLPFLPKAIGIVTSKSGAAIHDIEVKLNQRMPQIPRYLIDVRVQGEGAAEEIAEAIELFNEQALVDVLIVGRGGGSLQDLWAFNEEVVVRAIFASKIPIISAVGHEIDISLSDLVADVRAPTPTAAAEVVVPNRVELLARIAERESRLIDYERWLMPLGQRIDSLETLLSERIIRNFQILRAKLDSAAARAKVLEPHVQIERSLEKIKNHSERLFRACEVIYRTQDNSLQNLKLRLESLSPKKVLNRGYTMVRRGENVITEAKLLSKGDMLDIVFADGEVKSSVEGV